MINPKQPRCLSPAHSLNMARTAHPIIKLHRIHLLAFRLLPQAQSGGILLPYAQII